MKRELIAGFFIVFLKLGFFYEKQIHWMAESIVLESGGSYMAKYLQYPKVRNCFPFFRIALKKKSYETSKTTGLTV